MQKVLFAFVTMLFLQQNTLFGDPWGKDADLAAGCAEPKCSCENFSASILGGFADAMIHFHQEVISPADGPRSSFIPSSSQYALDAIHKYGFCGGVAMGCDRLMRENDDHWVYSWTRDGGGNLIKYDPVP